MKSLEQCLLDKSDTEIKLQYLGSLLHLTLFDKYQNVQLLITQSFTLLRDLLPVLELSDQTSLVESLKLISFGTLNRANK